jgi:hypothetical protein
LLPHRAGLHGATIAPHRRGLLRVHLREGPLHIGRLLLLLLLLLLHRLLLRRRLLVQLLLALGPLLAVALQIHGALLAVACEQQPAGLLLAGLLVGALAAAAGAAIAAVAHGPGGHAARGHAAGGQAAHARRVHDVIGHGAHGHAAEASADGHAGIALHQHLGRAHYIGAALRLRAAQVDACVGERRETRGGGALGG